MADENSPREVKILKDLPLHDLISAPLNAVINAQASAALTTASFIERVGLINKRRKRRGLFDRGEAEGDNYDIRVAKLKMEKKFIKTPAVGDPAFPDGMRAATPPDPPLGTNPAANDGAHPAGIPKFEPPVLDTTYEYIELPFLSLLNIPSFEVNELTWDFNVRLQSVEEFETDFATTRTTNVVQTDDFSLNVGKFLSVGATMKVEATSKTDFALRYGSSHDAEYNLKIGVRASTVQPPKGIDRLLGIAERIAANNEQLNAQVVRTTP